MGAKKRVCQLTGSWNPDSAKNCSGLGMHRLHCAKTQVQTQVSSSMCFVSNVKCEM